MRTNPRRFVGVVLRIAGSVALLVFLFVRTPDLEWDELVPDWDATTPFWLSGALMLTLTAHLLSAVRWQTVLRSLDQHEPLPRLVSHTLAAQFVSNFVPTTVGGDVLRVTRLGRDIEDRPVALASVVVERMSGWIVLPLITYFGFAVNPGLWHLGAATRTPFIVASLTLLALVAVVTLVGHGGTGRWLDRLNAPRFASAVHLGVKQIRSHRRAPWEIIGSAFAYQFCLLFAAGCGVEAMGIDRVGMTALMAFLPAVLIIQVLPLGIGGLGIREGALVVFLGGIGVSDEQAIALGLLIYFLTLASSLPGFLALIWGGRARGSETRTAVAEPAGTSR